MREIKFRAWIGDASTMSDVTGIEVNSQGPKWLTLLRPVPRPYQYKAYGQSSLRIAAHRALLMQYTGLRDKNGLEIYEGDIVRHIGRIEPIEFSQGAFCHVDKTGHTPLSNYLVQFMTVIGNIYENPELLETAS